VGSCRQLIGFSKPMDQRTLMVQLADTRAHLYTILKWCYFLRKACAKKPPSSFLTGGFFM
jgi:hypothetical protein